VQRVNRTRSSGNVFRDLGFTGKEAEHLTLRAELMVHLQKVIAARGLTQAEVAKLPGVAQPRVSDVMRRRLDLFSIDTPLSARRPPARHGPYGFSPSSGSRSGYGPT
jgi:predicted XRE-type DNA-binding protein